MKNRKLLIIAFLLSSTILMGVGFASVSGNLAVSGEAAFFGFEVLESNVAMSLKFTSATPTLNEEWCSVTIPELDDPNTPAHTAYMDVNFYDDNSSPTFTTAADFTITYGDASDNAPLPTITLKNLEATITPTINTDWPANEMFTCDVEWVSHTGDPNVVGKDTIELNDGDIVVVRVTVTFDKKEQEVANQELSGVINVGLPYAQVVDP